MQLIKQLMNTFSKNFILAADDFGISQEANDRILQLLREQKLSRIAVMVDGLISPEEIAELLVSGVKLDLHLDLDALKPQAKKRQLQAGVWKRFFVFVGLYLSGRLSASVAEISWEAQLKKFVSLFGKKPDGLNSHQHIHFFPPYFKVFLRLCQKNEVPYLRLGKNSFGSWTKIVCFFLNILRFPDFYFLQKTTLETSAFLVSFDWIKDFSKFLAKAPAGTIEIVCHPERTDEFAKIQQYF
jgi:predicted glycoside hydrolase/deacetylase ChbG (UPF0249 family)